MVQCLSDAFTVLPHEPLCSMDLCYCYFFLLYDSVLVTVVRSLLYNHVWFFFFLLSSLVAC
ncbi:unnamed protein product [Brassica rapa subsp. narinosa]